MFSLRKTAQIRKIPDSNCTNRDETRTKLDVNSTKLDKNGRFSAVLVSSPALRKF